MNYWIAFAAFLSGYLLGGISFARLIGKYAAPGENLLTTEVDIAGSDKKAMFRGVSATTIGIRKGPKLGCLTSILDAMKVFIPTLVFRLVYPEMDYFLIAAAAGVAGHNFPIYYKFKGGMGISPLFGALLVIDWVAIPVTTLISSILGFVVFKDLFLAYAGTTIVLIPWLWWRFNSLSYVLFAVVVCILFWTAALPTLKGYFALKRSGEFNKANLLETGHSAKLIEGLKKRGLIKSIQKQNQNTRNTE